MKGIFFTLLLLVSTPSWATLNVFACEPEWAALAEELGGDKLKVFSATTGLQDAHYIQAKPSLIAKARRADLLVCTGAELESGWLPLLQRKAGNADIQTGADGYFMATDFVTLKEIPTDIDRSHGHLHAAGNPHIQTSPAYILAVAEQLNLRLQRLDQANASFYQQRWLDFQQRWQQAMQKWDEQAASLKGTKIIVQHESFVYLREWLGLNRVAVLEPKPGVPPSVGDLSRVAKQLKQQPAKMVLVSAYQSTRASDWLVDKTGIKRVILPFTVGGNQESGDLFKLFDNTISLLQEANR